MASFYVNSASFDYLEVTTSLSIGPAVQVNLGSVTSTFSGSFSGSLVGNGSRLTNITIPVFKTTTDSPTLTGTTANTLLTQSLIPANTFVPGEIIEITARTVKTGAAGSMTQRWYINNTSSLTGATLIATHPVSALFLQLSRQVVIKSNTSAEIFSASLASFTDDANVAGSSMTITTDWTANQYILFALQNANATDSSKYSYYKILPL